MSYFYKSYQKNLWTKKMEISQLKTFIAIAKEKNLTRAAQKLFLTQPALSNQLKLLEEELDLNLFLRTPKGMELTREGKNMLEEAERVMGAVDRMKHRSQEIQKKLLGSVRLGVNIAVGMIRLEQIYQAIQDSGHPIELNLVRCKSPEIIEEVRKRELDMGFFLGDASFSDVQLIELSKIDLCLVGPSEWKKDLKNFSVEELATYPWVLFPNWCPFTQAVENFVNENKIKPKMIADTEELLSNLVEAGHGFSFLLRPDAEKREKRGEVFIVPGYNFKVTLSLAYLPENLSSPVVRFVFELINKVWGKDESKP